ncbi:uncharacterized protein IWZ02DRAFT_212441 [Phyllosticta citriasiana]|uniref:Carboxymuconolactone decarboxylase-like domain-containing protein n=1 Tax=Phyllosticta citriasiana TaxID=595635 RepID=A0ABR1KMT8_9PEZI
MSGRVRNDGPFPHDLRTLLTTIHLLLPKSMPKSGAYLLPAAAITALGHPNLLGPLFTDVLAFSPERSSKKISLQLRDVLLKQWTLIGIPLVVTAVSSLASAEKASGIEFPPGLSSKYAKPDSLAPSEAMSARGEKFMRKLYLGNLEPILSTWGSHEADFTWLEKSVIYGLFLSDHEVLSEIETELVIMTSIMAQNLKGPTLWHMRGLRRLGISKKDVEETVKIVTECARYLGHGEKDWVTWVGEVDGEV